LQILGTRRHRETTRKARSSFVATYKLNKLKLDHRERATFRGRRQVVFIDGVELKGPPVKRTEPRVGRNDPCPCGSGKNTKSATAVDA